MFARFFVAEYLLHQKKKKVKLFQPCDKSSFQKLRRFFYLLYLLHDLCFVCVFSGWMDRELQVLGEWVRQLILFWN
jgi:hypothetical protein